MCMKAELIDGRSLARRLRRHVKLSVADLVESTGIVPGLTVVLVGEDPASMAYIKGKETACSSIGIRSETVMLPADATEERVVETVEELNRNPLVHGILVQLPLPGQIRVERVINSISPLKDVDCFHPENLGLMFRDRPRFLPCTPAGVIDVIRSLPLEFEGKHAVVVGRSLIVGKPVAVLLLKENMTVTVCHSRTSNLARVVGTADLVVAAVGRARFVQGSWLKPGAVVIDVGINSVAEGGLVGDVDFRSACEVASYITPVPRGVGPLTVARLLSNVLAAARQAAG